MKDVTSCCYYVIVLATLGMTSLSTSEAFTLNRRKRQASTLQQVQYENCGVMGNDAVISLVDLDIRPMPIRSPGKLKMSVRVNVTQTLPTTLAVDVRVSKYMMGLPLKIPCYNSIGSCSYLNVCHLLSELRAHYGCPRFLTRHGVACRCPVKAGLYSLLDLRFDIPALEGITSFLAKGKYEGEIRIYDQVTSLEYGCIRINIAMKRRQKRRHNSLLPLPYSSSHRLHASSYYYT